MQASSLNSPSSGHLYYVRLKTELGIFYKLGFTTMGSVQQRLGFKGSNDDDLIEQVLLFIYLDNAYEVEQLLHNHFHGDIAFPLPDEKMPFFKNGQSELYIKDILGLCELPSSEVETRFNIRRALGDYDDLQPKEVQEHKDLMKDAYESINNLKHLLSGVLKLVRVITDWFTPHEEKVRKARVSAILQELKLKSRTPLLLNKIRKAKAKSIIKPGQQLKVDFLKAYELFKQGDLNAFESIVDVGDVARNIANARTNCLIGTDYHIIAMNCGMYKLMDEMNGTNKHELLCRPAISTYKVILRAFVQNKRLPTEKLMFLNDPLYHVEDLQPAYSLDTHFGIGHFLDLVGRQWTLPSLEEIFINDNTLQLEVRVRDARTGFQGKFTVYGGYTDQYKLTFWFSDLMDLDEEASKYRFTWDKAAGLIPFESERNVHWNEINRNFMY